MVYPQFYDQRALTRQYQHNAKQFCTEWNLYMYKGNNIHSNDLKFNPTELKKKPAEKKDNQETNNKDYETIRKVVKGTDKPTTHISSIIYKW